MKILFQNQQIALCANRSCLIGSGERRLAGIALQLFASFAEYSLTQRRQNGDRLRLCDVRFWHKADVNVVLINFWFWDKNGH